MRGRGRGSWRHLLRRPKWTTHKPPTVNHYGAHLSAANAANAVHAGRGGEGRHHRAQEVLEELKWSNSFFSLSLPEGSQEQSRTTDRAIGDTGPPARMTGSLEEIDKSNNPNPNPPPSQSRAVCTSTDSNSWSNFHFNLNMKQSSFTVWA